MQLDVNKAGRVALALAMLAAAGGAQASMLTHQPDWVQEGTVADAQFGGVINAQGDFNKDGFKDLLVSSSASQGTQRGAIELFYGSRKGPAKTAAWRYEGTMDWSQVGSSPVVADVNGDGWPDLVVGAYNQSGAVPYNGAVLVFLGSAKGLPATPSQVLEGPSSNSFFGWKIRALGDFNHDGYADIAVSAMGANGNLGTISIYKGSASGLAPTPVSTLTGAAPWTYFGRIFEVGDTNGDGIPDILVGAVSPVGGIPGMAWIYRGSTSGYANTQAETLLSPVELADLDGFGESVAVLGDVDGDGYPDVAVAAPSYRKNFKNSGLIAVFYGSANGIAASGRTQILEANSTKMLYLGMTMLGGRDVDGDGRPDLVVGTADVARPADPTEPFPGGIWIYHGSPTGLDTTNIYKVYGKKDSRDEVGINLEVSDVTGDGVMDLITGSSLYTDTLEYQGVARIYRGVKTQR
ncbi:FG-GAP-like repeat-containing protein [Ideonella sp. B508-1]|uniref:FG-GAP-like repeat-containing protein n=1 Tax=Ideonella sp. B508-1 TaxID=137716 RepID=UPI00034BD351|nr:FG-GAP-like repeat-containing protein [Ideonella sp. B508-1]